MRAAAALAIGCAACGPSAYACTEHEQCVNADVAGVCQANGLCSFPDDDCPSGQRYGEHGGAMSGQCVAPVGDTDAGSSTSATSSSSVTSLDVTGPTTTDSLTDPVTVTISTSTSTDADSTTSTSASSTETSTGGPVAVEPLLWFAFEDMNAGIVNLGSLGGFADCTDVSCPAAVEGIVGTAAQFDGIDDCAIFPFVPELGPLDSLTIAAWLQRDATGADYDCVLCKPVGVDPWNTWRLATYDDPRSVAIADFRVGTADDSGISLPAPIPAGTWTHIVGTWDGETMRLWIDGEVMLESPNTFYEVDEQPVYLGCDDDHGVIGITNFLTGTVDEVRLYARAIDDDEIAALYAQGNP